MPWEDVRMFLAVAESGSFSAAAKKLRVTQPTVSRKMAELEALVGEPLLSRAAFGVTLTSFGERLLEPARRMAEWAAEVERAAERAETAPEGVVRVTAPPGIAFEFVAPFAASIKAKLPRVWIEVLANVQFLDLSRRDADLALRFAAPTQRDVITLATLDLEVGAFATEAYAKTLPRKKTLADIGWIGWAPPYDDLSPNPELARAIPGFRPVFASDDFLVQLRAAEAGLGAIFLGRVEHRFSTQGPLVELDVDVGPITRTLYLACARSVLEIPRVRAVADLLVTELQRTHARRRKR